MSLVYEALQKAEREKERKTGAIPAAPAAVPPQPVRTAAAPPATPAVAPKDNSRSYLSVLIVGVSLVAVAALAYVVVIASQRATELRPNSEGGSRPGVTAPETAVRPEPRPPAEAAATATATENNPRFKLTGIMKMGDSFGAVINGRVVYQDNYVDGAVVKKVERDRVTLDVNGRETVLRLF